MSIARLSFDEGKGAKALDASTEGLNNFGRLLGGATRTAGKFGQAVRLDGKDDVVNVRNSEDINRGTHTERTISMWFKADNAMAGQKQVLLEEGNSARGINLVLEDGLLNFGSWDRPALKWQGDWASGGKVASGKWNHVALVLDGEATIKDNAITAYLNGQQIGQTKGAQLLSHGARSLGNVSGNTRFDDGIGRNRSAGFDGSIDEVQVFNDALSAGDVKQLAAGIA